MMKRYCPVVLCAISMLGGITMEARAQAQEAGAHVAAAKAVMSPQSANPKPWQTYASLFRTVCTPPRKDAPPPKVGPGEPDEKAKLVPTPRDKWYVPPVKVFDNLYFIGTQTESTWALTTSAGIILLNTNFPWVTPDLLNELKTFGLDPADIKYAIIVRSHSDQSWGINALKKIAPSARVIMGEKDWDLLAKDNTPGDLKPMKDMVAKDGEKLTLGDTTVRIYFTPTSTPGSISLIFPVKEGNQTHVGGMLGGDLMRLVQEGVQLYPDMQTEAKTYVAAMKRFKEIEDKAGVDALIHPHSEDDNSLLKLDAVRSRKPGDPNPFVIGKDDVDRFMTLHVECGEAQLAWARVD
jgi:metallo-beta-lactamase class B